MLQQAPKLYIPATRNPFIINRCSPFRSLTSSPQWWRHRRLIPFGVRYACRIPFRRRCHIHYVIVIASRCCVCASVVATVTSNCAYGTPATHFSRTVHIRNFWWHLRAYDEYSVSGTLWNRMGFVLSRRWWMKIGNLRVHSGICGSCFSIDWVKTTYAPERNCFV